MDITEVSASEPEKTPERKPWGFWSTFGLGVSVLIGISIVEGLIGIVFGIWFFFKQLIQDSAIDISKLTEYMNSILGLMVSVNGIISAVVGIGLIILFIRFRKGFSMAEYLGLKSITPKTIIAVLGITLAFLLLAGTIEVLIGRPEDDFTINAYRTSIYTWLLWMTLIIIVPVFEEAFFRGFLYKGFVHSRIGVIGTVILTSFLWAIMHIQYDYFGIVEVFFMGMLLGVLRYKTGSLWSPLLMHSFFNLIALIQTSIIINGYLN